MSRRFERGVIPPGNGCVYKPRERNPYNQMDASKCPICGESRGPTKNHKRCSRILQRQSQEKNNV